MKIKYLDGMRLYYAVLAGGQAVIADKSYLDKINVFPVPDSDTGTNMATTMRAIAEKATPSRCLKTTVRSIADAALVGARGNSGLIFAQFLYGLSQEIRTEVRLTTRHFAESVRSAAQYSRKAMLSPVEGTMITLIHDWAEAVYEHRHRFSDYTELLSYSLHVAEQSLRDTPKKLAVLAKAGVVDAGAQGFFDFLKGVVDFIRKGDLKAVIDAAAAPPDVPSEDVHAERSSVGLRYCSEALITGEAIDLESLRALVQGAGESAIVAGSPSKVRIHVHTDSPADLFLKIEEVGTIADVKADDMLRQYQAAHERKSPIALLTDSSCDLPRAVLDEHQIHLVPFSLFFGDSTYLDKITINPEEFYKLLRARKEMPTTAQPSQGNVRRIVEFLAGHYESIIAVTISGKLTGFYGQVVQAADSLGLDPSRITVIDSRHLSVSEALVVLRAAEAVRAGRSHEEISREAPSWVAKTKLWVDIKTLRYMVRGGRVSPLKGLVAGLLNIKPIISLDEEGKAVALGKSFSRRQNMNKILKMIRTEAAGRSVWNFGIVHAQNPIRALHYADFLSESLGKKPAFISEVSPVVGVHNGIGVVGLSVMFE
jgi:DegV family protein with EDD domain